MKKQGFVIINYFKHFLPSLITFSVGILHQVVCVCDTIDNFNGTISSMAQASIGAFIKHEQFFFLSRSTMITVPAYRMVVLFLMNLLQLYLAASHF